MRDFSRPVKVCMISYLHNLYDDRIYWKESIALKENGFDVCCLGITQSPLNEISSEGIKLIGITKNTKSNFFGKLKLLFSRKSVFKQLVDIAASEKADVYHLHDFQLNIIGAALKRLEHRPRVIYDAHEPFPVTLTTTANSNLLIRTKEKLKRYILNYWEKRMAGKYDLIITTEDHVAEQFRKHLPGIPVSVIWNYSDLKREIADVEPTYDFIYCGGLMERRGAFEMIRSVNNLKKRGISTTLLIVGSIFSVELQRKMNNYIKENNLTEDITILDPVPYQKIASYYGQSRFALALFKDVEVNRIIMPIKIFEYITMYLPVVCSNFGYMNRITSTYQTGITVNPDSDEDISNAMEKLLTNDNLASQLKMNCQKAAVDFDWEKMKSKLVDLYNNLLQSSCDV